MFSCNGLVFITHFENWVNGFARFGGWKYLTEEWYEAWFELSKLLDFVANHLQSNT